MRLVVLAFTLLPMAAHAQSNTLPEPTDPVAQSQSCPVGMTWDSGAQTCAIGAESISPMNDLSDRSGCSQGSAREVTS